MLARKAHELKGELEVIKAMLVKSSFSEGIDYIDAEQFELMKATLKLFDDMIEYMIAEAEESDEINNKLDKVLVILNSWRRES